MVETQRLRCNHVASNRSATFLSTDDVMRCFCFFSGKLTTYVVLTPPPNFSLTSSQMTPDMASGYTLGPLRCCSSQQIHFHQKPVSCMHSYFMAIRRMNPIVFFYYLSFYRSNAIPRHSLHNEDKRGYYTTPLL